MYFKHFLDGETMSSNLHSVEIACRRNRMYIANTDLVRNRICSRAYSRLKRSVWRRFSRHALFERVFTNAHSGPI